VEGLAVQKDKSVKSIEYNKGIALVIYQWNQSSKQAHLEYLI
jgi:hypothetical protein